MAAMNISYDPEEQRLFTDSSMHISVVAHGKGTAFNPCCKCQPQEGNIRRHEENSQLRELNNISMAHLQLFEDNCHFGGTARITHNTSTVVSCANGIVVPEVFTTTST